MSDQIIIFDTTLRDGEQSPGCSMNLDEKIRMAIMLDELGIDVIEAGFPAASKGDFDAVFKISKTLKKARIAGLCRALEKDIDAVAEAIKPAQKGRIHTFISTSPLHMKHKLQKTPEQVLELIKSSVSYARNLCDDVEWSAEDGSRTEDDFLCQSVEVAITAGARTINIPDTVGYSIPEEYFRIIHMLKNRVPNIDEAILSVHCHNDLGLAVANSLAGVQAGARQVECTINGIGERAGNASLEEFVMALRTRHDLLPFSNNIITQNIMKTSRMLSSITGFNVQPNKAIVGANAFAHESGIHQDGMLKHAGTYEIMTPESVGRSKTNLVLGKHSGRNAFSSHLKELGYELDDTQINSLFTQFKDLADKKKDIFDEDLIKLITGKAEQDNDRIKFVSLRINAGSEGPQTATLKLIIDNEEQETTVNGNGPVDATFNAIKALYPHEGVILQLYQVHAVTEGTDAQAEVTVRLQGGETDLINGIGADTDVIVASCKAYTNALNRMITKKGVQDVAEKIMATI